MSDAKYWRGPWSIVPRRDGHANIYCGPHDVALAVRPGNAQLIAAAPDMLRALELAADFIAYRAPGSECRNILLAQIRQAIAKATNERP